MNEFARLPVGSRPRKPRSASARGSRKPRAHYYAFLSYSHRDEELADWLHQELEDFHVPAALAGKVTANGVVPRRLKPIFRDEHELAAADDLGEEIRSALAASQFLIVLCSPSAATSHWTNAEVETFKRLRPDGCIFAVVGSGEPFASEIKGRADEECFPPALREKYDRRGRPTGKKAEPLAADLRGNPDDRRMGFLKLVAGMLGVGLDDLVQRETTRRQRRMAWVASGSMLGMLVATGLAVTAIQARDAARDQRREAEGLVAFMLGDLKDKLEPIGKLDALDGVGARVLAYYRNQDASQLSDAGLMQRSQALSLSAQVAYSRGDLTAAQKLYHEAMDGTAEAISRAPRDPQRLFDHAQNVFYVAQIAASQGNLAEAEREFREYQRLANQMIALQPDNLKWRMEVQYSEANLGFILLRLRRFPEAAAQFGKALSTIEAVATLDKTNLDYQVSTAETLAWLADAELSRGNLAAALSVRQRQVALLRSLLPHNGDVQLRQKLIPAQQVYGRLLAASGRAGPALEQLTGAADTADKLIAEEPTNSIWLGFGAGAHFALADFYRGDGDMVNAAASAARGCALSATLSKLSKSAFETRYTSWACTYLRGAIALQQGQIDEARAEADRAATAARTISSSDRIADSFLLARSLLLAGDALARSGDASRSRAAWQQALALARAPNEQPWESAIRADILSRLGGGVAASSIRISLRKKGIVNVEILRG